jgi:pyruvate dehydrogenase E2 component (dihydrolipoamide acetyltransferase)
LKPVEAEATAAAPAVAATPAQSQAAAPAAHAQPARPEADYEDIEISNIRKVIAKRLLFSKVKKKNTFILRPPRKIYI